MDVISAYIFSSFTLIAILFQLALAFGAPWGEMAMGGKYPGKFPPNMRFGAIINAMVLAFMVLIVLNASGVLSYFGSGFISIAIWFVVGFFVLGTILHIITPSKKERMIWLPVNLVLLISSFYIAIN